jgi:hypothetical protein
MSFLISSRTFTLLAVKINFIGSGAAALANSIAEAFPIPAEAPVIRTSYQLTNEKGILFYWQGMTLDGD